MAGSETAIQNITGGQALQNQSLEGAKKIGNRKIVGAMPFVLENLIKGRMKGNYHDCCQYLIKRGLTSKEAKQTVKLLAKNGASIVKLTF